MEERFSSVFEIFSGIKAIPSVGRYTFGPCDVTSGLKTLPRILPHDLKLQGFST
ncbi:hypothetical protein PanWU01x14_003090, partial [Parasponia andersonii]